MKRLNIIAALSLSLLLGSCDLLNMEPMDQISDVSFWKSSKDFQLAANGFYFSLTTVPQYIDQNSDIAYGSGANDVSDGSYLALVNSGDWDQPYEYIQSTSYLLEKAEQSGRRMGIFRPQFLSTATITG